MVGMESERSLPIDIQCRKLLDWLVSRRICGRDWHEKVLPVRQMIGEAVEDMPEHPEILEILRGSNLHYFNCLRIVEILKETEKDTRGFFGQYGSRRMNDWLKIVSAYQKDQNLYLAESAALLTRAVAYDLPGVKKAAAKAGQTAQECDRRLAELDRKAKDFRADHAKACQDLGVIVPVGDGAGKSARAQILAQLDEGLPEAYREIAAQCRDLVVDHKFVRIYCRSSSASKILDPPGIAGNAENALTALRFLADRGNVTTYEWVYGEAPLVVEAAVVAIEDKDEEEIRPDKDDGEQVVDLEVEEIDWGDLGNSKTNSNEDDLEMVPSNNPSEETEIDWDLGEDEDIVVESSGVEGGVARDADALSLLDNRRTRNLILDDLHELAAFLQQRLYEIQEVRSNPAAAGGFGLNLDDDRDDEETSSSGPEAVTEQEARAGLAKAQSLISRLTTGRLHHLQLVRGSPKYVDRLVEGLNQKFRLVRRTEQATEEATAKREACLQEQSALMGEFRVIQDKARSLQRHVEQDISGRYDNRKVNVVGGVQSV